MSMNKRKNNCGCQNNGHAGCQNHCQNNDCEKLEHYSMEFVAYTMKMQACVTKKINEARACEKKADAIREKAECLDKQADMLLREAEELNRELECQLKKSNALLLKTIQCYKGRNTVVQEDCCEFEYPCYNESNSCDCDCSCKDDYSCYRNNCWNN